MAGTYKTISEWIRFEESKVGLYNTYIIRSLPIYRKHLNVKSYCTGERIPLIILARISRAYWKSHLIHWSSQFLSMNLRGHPTAFRVLHSLIFTILFIHLFSSLIYLYTRKEEHLLQFKYSLLGIYRSSIVVVRTNITQLLARKEMYWRYKKEDKEKKRSLKIFGVCPSICPVLVFRDMRFLSGNLKEISFQDSTMTAGYTIQLMGACCRCCSLRKTVVVGFQRTIRME